MQTQLHVLKMDIRVEGDVIVMPSCEFRALLQLTSMYPKTQSVGLCFWSNKIFSARAVSTSILNFKASALSHAWAHFSKKKQHACTKYELFKKAKLMKLLWVELSFLSSHQCTRLAWQNHNMIPERTMMTIQKSAKKEVQTSRQALYKTLKRLALLSSWWI